MSYHFAAQRTATAEETGNKRWQLCHLEPSGLRNHTCPESDVLGEKSNSPELAIRTSFSELSGHTDASDPPAFVPRGTTTPRRTPSLPPASRQGRPSSGPRWGGSPFLRSPPAGHSLAATPQNGSLPSLGLEARRASDTEGRAVQTGTQRREQNRRWLEETPRGAESHLSASAAWRPFARGMLPPAGRTRGRSAAAALTVPATWEGAELSGWPQPHPHPRRARGRGGGVGGDLGIRSPEFEFCPPHPLVAVLAASALLSSKMLSTLQKF